LFLLFQLLFRFDRRTVKCIECSLCFLKFSGGTIYLFLFLLSSFDFFLLTDLLLFFIGLNLYFIIILFCIFNLLISKLFFLLRVILRTDSPITILSFAKSNRLLFFNEFLALISSIIGLHWRRQIIITARQIWKVILTHNIDCF